MSTPFSLNRRVEGKRALVTGAARGIGEAVARLLAAHGARVLVTDLNEPGAHAVAASIGPAAAALRLDVREEADWIRAMDSARALLGGLDVLVNNAAITGFESPSGLHDPEHASLDAWRAVHATNLDGVFLGCKHAIRAMRAGGGSIINMSSRSGQVGIPGAAAYASSKAGVRNHTKTVALYCAERGSRIRCNSVHPGAILTPMWEAVLGDGEQREANLKAVTADVPLGRMGTPEEVAALVLYLASDESAYTTGAEFVIDGGILAGATAAPRK
jgi:3(or 17)beta-hydroxysteroid dehydrogenase